MWKNKPMVYLSGGISGKTYEDGNAWREHVTTPFLDAGFVVASPLRDRWYKGECDSDTQPYELSEIFVRDLMDLKYADVLLAELTSPDRNYFGTTSEIVIAQREYDIPIIVWAESETRKKELEYSWIAKWAMKILVDLDDAVDYVVNLFNYEEPWQQSLKHPYKSDSTICFHAPFGEGKFVFNKLTNEVTLVACDEMDEG